MRRPGRTLALAASLLSLSVAAIADQTTRYSILFSGTAGGEQTTTLAAGERVKVAFEYSVNGRGPALKEDMQLASDGTLLRYQVSGKSTFGAPVSESFSRRADQARWHSHSDEGKTAVAGPAMYVPVERSYETTALIARAAARRPNRKIAALPGGDLSVEKLAAAQLESGGSKVSVALFSIAGLSIQPTLIWLTDDAWQRFFAFLDPGTLTAIERGWEGQGAALEALQVGAEGELLEKLAGRLGHRFSDPVLFRNVRVFDSRNARLLDAADVYVHGERIAAVYAPGSAPRGKVVEIDGAGRVLSPALFDMHAHESPWNGVLQIAGGVTTSRDMGSDNATLAELNARFDRGELLGPRVVPMGFIEGQSPFSARLGLVVKDVQEAKDAIDWYAQRGYRQVKLYNSFRPEWVEPAAAHAHQRGLRVSGHIPAFMRAEQAVRAGFDEIQHINQVMLNFLVGPEDDTRTLARFYLMTERAHELDLDAPRVQEFLRLLQERGTVIDPTLAVFEDHYLQQQGQMHPGYAAIAAHLPVGKQRSWRTNTMNVTAKNAGRYRKSWERVLEFVGRMHRAGIPFVAGTDEIAGFTLHRELELYVQAGLAPAEALRIATWNGALHCGLEGELGSIERGKKADLILIDGDPTRDISAIRRISLVMKEGAVFYPAEVYEALGVKRFVDPPAVSRSVLVDPAR